MNAKIQLFEQAKHLKALCEEEGLYLGWMGLDVVSILDRPIEETSESILLWALQDIRNYAYFKGCNHISSVARSYLQSSHQAYIRLVTSNYSPIGHQFDFDFEGTASHSWYERVNSYPAYCLCAEHRLLAIGEDDGLINLWDCLTAEKLGEFRLETPACASIGAVTISSDGELLAAIARDGSVGAWKIKKGNKILSTYGISYELKTCDIAISRQNSYLAYAGRGVDEHRNWGGQPVTIIDLKTNRHISCDEDSFNGKLYFGKNENLLYCFDGMALWKLDLTIDSEYLVKTKIRHIWTELGGCTWAVNATKLKLQPCSGQLLVATHLGTVCLIDPDSRDVLYCKNLPDESEYSAGRDLYIGDVTARPSNEIVALNIGIDYPGIYVSLKTCECMFRIPQPRSPMARCVDFLNSNNFIIICRGLSSVIPIIFQFEIVDNTSSWPEMPWGDSEKWEARFANDTQETWEDRIAEYDALDAKDFRKADSWAIGLIHHIDFNKYPELRSKVQQSIESAFEAMRHMSAEGDTMAGGEKTAAEYHYFAKQQGANPIGLKYNDGEEIAPEYHPLVWRYAHLMSDSPKKCIDFLLKLVCGWHQMYLRHNAFSCFSEKTDSAGYAFIISEAILNEEEMDTRTPMLEWLAKLDYSSHMEIVPHILKIAEILVENPCAGRVPVYIGNDDAIPEVRDAAELLITTLRKYESKPRNNAG